MLSESEKCKMRERYCDVVRRLISRYSPGVDVSRTTKLPVASSPCCCPSGSSSFLIVVQGRQHSSEKTSGTAALGIAWTQSL